jgi:uncharacterized membrane protein YidH (DUF202 family)
MSGETEEHVSGWTTDTLKAHFDDLRRTDQGVIEQRFKAAEERTTLALTAADRAVVKAETATEKRFDAVNEFRATLADQASRLMPRAEVEQIVKGMSEKIDDLRGTRRTGYASIGALVVGAAVVLAVLVQIIVLLVKG